MRLSIHLIQIVLRKWSVKASILNE